MSKAMQESLGKSSSHLYSKALEFAQQKSRDAKILDIGCGAGDLLTILKKNGFANLTGCDGYSFGVPGEIRFIQKNLNEPWRFSETFELIFSLEVIEHLENPRAFFREAYGALAKGGSILVSTPNNESITSLISLAIKGNFSAFVGDCYPAHITPVLSMDAERMAKEAGFQKIEILYSNHGRMPGIRHHWQDFFGGLCAGKRFSDNFFLRAEK